MSVTAPSNSRTDIDRARMLLDPLKRQVLDALRQPHSAASLARSLEMPRQKLGYHLRALEAAGLVRLVEERRRRGFTERILLASTDAFDVATDLLAGPVFAQDRYASTYLVQAAAAVMRDVARMQTAADQAGQRLLTFTIEAELGFAHPGEIELFSKALGEAVGQLASRFMPGENRRLYHLIAATHPATAVAITKSIS